MTYFGDTKNEQYSGDKYDMTHFSKNFYNGLRQERRLDKVVAQHQISSNRALSKIDRNDVRSGIVRDEILRNFERKRLSNSGGGNGWPPIGIPLSVPNDMQPDFKHKKTRNLPQIIEKPHSRAADMIGGSKEVSGKKNQLAKNDETLDLDIEIKPLTELDDKYFTEDISKLSSIPRKPNLDSEATQKIEHVRTNIVSKSAIKKTNVGVLVGGKLDKTKADVVQYNSPDPTYDKVKDFFKSQQLSSIVDAPLAEKKEAVKFYNIPHEESRDVKRSSIPKPSVRPDRIRLDLKER